jgi:heme/copper-type cytochrome/quinol oxidase subunit 4
MAGSDGVTQKDCQQKQENQNNMIKKIIKMMIIAIGAIVQIALLVIPWILEDLCTKKAGVMHHVYYRKAQYANSIFSEGNLIIESMGAVIIALVFGFILFRAFRRKQTLLLKIETTIGFVLSIIFPIIAYSENFRAKLSYPYFLICLAAGVFLQVIFVAGIKIFDGKSRNK